MSIAFIAAATFDLKLEYSKNLLEWCTSNALPPPAALNVDGEGTPELGQ